MQRAALRRGAKKGTHPLRRRCGVGDEFVERDVTDEVRRNRGVRVVARLRPVSNRVRAEPRNGACERAAAEDDAEEASEGDTDIVQAEVGEQ